MSAARRGRCHSVSRSVCPGGLPRATQAAEGLRSLRAPGGTLAARCGTQLHACSFQSAYPLLMTLILGMSKPEGIYLSVDYRVTDLRTRRLVDDETTKSLTIHYPPLNDNGPKVLLGFSGLAVLKDGTPTMTWIRETLRGETQVIDASMAHLRKRLNRDIASLGVPLIVNLLVLEKDRRLVGAFTNMRSKSGRVSTMNHFEYVMTELNDWFIFANGSGALRLLKDGHLARLQPHLSIVPRKPMNHMNLLAGINRQVAVKDNSVSPFCKVSFLNADDRFQAASEAFTNRGETVPFEMPILFGGLDFTDLTRDFMRNFQDFSEGRVASLPEPDTDEMNRRLKRRP